MNLIFELNGLIHQIEDEESKERAFDIVESLEKIISAKQIIVKPPALPENEIIRMLQDQIISLRQDLNRYHTRTFT